MDTVQTLALIALGALLGAIGQGTRALVGIKKEMDDAKAATAAGKPTPDWFNGKELGFSFLLGAIAGVLAAVLQLEPGATPTRDMLLGFAGAGYAGADFIGGAMQKWMPGK